MDSFTKEVLAYCNDVRKRLDLPEIGYIVPGKIAQAYNCPVARTIANGTEYSVSTYEYVMVKPDPTEIGGYVINEPTPLYVRRWMRKFDEREYSDYIYKG